MKGIVVAGTHSGVGKTTVTLGLMVALRRRGLTTQPFKAGPDYIDPGYHRIICGRPSYNLDTWMMGRVGTKKSFFTAMKGADIGIVEGVMGLFDGNERGEEGSTAHLAKVLGLPVILVVDARGLSRSAGAIVYGFERFDPKVDIAGVIFNRVGGERHFKMLKEVVLARSKLKVLGYIPKDEEITLPERHLGLVMAEEPVVSGQWSVVRRRLIESVERYLDIDGIIQSSRFKIQDSRSFPLTTHHSPLTTRIGVALDEAFCFYYQENLEILEESGAELIFFSPSKDKRLPDGIKGIYIGGGYPELYAKNLAANKEMRGQIKRLAERGLPVYAECGGLMYLGKGLRDLEGKTYEMVGIFPWISRMLERKRSLGYREVVVTGGCPFIKKGQKVRGHEFHYSEIDEPPPRIKRVYRVTYNPPSPPFNPPSSPFEKGGAEGDFTKGGREGLEGYLYKNTLASYVHLHFASNPEFARGFVSSCIG